MSMKILKGSDMFRTHTFESGCQARAELLEDGRVRIPEGSYANLNEGPKFSEKDGNPLASRQRSLWMQDGTWVLSKYPKRVRFTRDVIVGNLPFWAQVCYGNRIGVDTFCNQESEENPSLKVEPDFEEEIMRLVLARYQEIYDVRKQSLTHVEAAKKLGISESTLRKHLKNIDANAYELGVKVDPNPSQTVSKREADLVDLLVKSLRRANKDQKTQVLIQLCKELELTPLY